jgi:hypothetical protein
VPKTVTELRVPAAATVSVKAAHCASHSACTKETAFGMQPAHTNVCVDAPVASS